MIVGVSGFYASGKGEIVEYLRERSFEVLSLSDVIRDELRKLGEEETRERMIDCGNSIREREGNAALADRLARDIKLDRNYVIDSIRHPEEVERLRTLGHRFVLIWVDASPDTRLQRIRERARVGDPSDLGQLEAFELREREGSVYSQKLDDVRELADYSICNEGSRKELYEQLQQILQTSLYFDRPSWDEYFMSIARVVATRSNCVKRNVAAVITMDRRLISTGYNGTPRGVTNCNEGGCSRCGSFGPSGAQLGDCVCSHAEENAIVQAAYHGVRVAGSTVYTTFCPCLMCTKMIINSGIREVVYAAQYPLGQISIGLLAEAGVEARQLA